MIHISYYWFYHVPKYYVIVGKARTEAGFIFLYYFVLDWNFELGAWIELTIKKEV
jgi:hypothetical protein